jgi:transmembrane sensor
MENRSVNLVAGYALFSVVHDQSRPFSVNAGPIQVRALGTEFNVQKKEVEEVVVEVVTGRVNVSRKLTPTRSVEVDKATDTTATQPESEQWLLAARSEAFEIEKIIEHGQEVVISEKKPGFQIHNADIKRINSWKDGNIDFDKAPLADVIQEINRYVDRKIIIGDDRLKSMRVSMIFRIVPIQGYN